MPSKLIINLVHNCFGLGQRLLALFIDVEKESLLICPQNGRHLAGNALHFANYLDNENVHFYILVKSKTSFLDLKRSFGNRVLYSYSFSAIVAFSSARSILITHGLGDFYPFKINLKRQNLINIWHAIALKNVGRRAKNSTNVQVIQKLAKSTTAFILSSNEEKEIISDSLMLKDEQIFVTGLPKNDILVHEKYKLEEQIKYILYAPTFRDKGNTKIFPFKDFDVESLNDFLKENDLKILLRHHINQNDPSEKSLISENILEAHASIYPDAQDLLLKSYALITDYSGIYFDFLLLNRPVMFFPYDLDQYSAERSFPYEYDEVTPGPKIYSQFEFIKYLDELLAGQDEFQNFRLSVKDRIHKYQDGKSNDRLLSLINRLS